MADIKPVVELATKQFLRKKEEMAQNGKILSEEQEMALFASCIHLQTLTTPDSAKLPPLEDSYVAKADDGSYRVSGYLDSQSGDGTYIRSQYTYNIKRVNGQLQCTDVFVDAIQEEQERTRNEFNKIFNSRTILWWILGIISTIITITVSTCQVNTLF